MAVKKRKVKNEESKKFSLNSLFYGNFRLALNYLKESKNYVWISVLLFFIIALIGFILPVFFQEQITKIIQDIIKQTEGLDTFNLIRFIFINNLKSSGYAMFFGILFGIIPLGVVIVNGYILGFIANKAIAAGGILVLWRLLPHGIFELPAVFISIGLGLKLGSFLFSYKKKDKFREFGKWLLNSLRVFVFIVIPLLILAAIIEGSLIIFFS